jgi:hypothetical protein
MNMASLPVTSNHTSIPGEVKEYFDIITEKFVTTLLPAAPANPG